LANFWLAEDEQDKTTMAIGSILLGVALLVLLALFIARPFFSPPEKEVALTEQQLLLNEKEALLDQIQLLDFDHDTGKLPTELHAFQRERLVEQATAVLTSTRWAGWQTLYPHLKQIAH
jgi:hypothetical protein